MQAQKTPLSAYLSYRLEPCPECPAALLLLLRRTPPPPLLALLPCPPVLLL
jgi:hypothetical protein